MRRLVFPLLALGLLSGCASAAPESPATTQGTTAMPNPVATTLSLDIGARATLPDGSQLTYVALINDSRCPPDVQCVWAGDAEIELRWDPKNGGSARQFSLHTNPLKNKGARAIDLGTFNLRLQALERGIAPKATLDVTPHS